MNNQPSSRGIWEWEIVKYVVGLSSVFFILLLFYFGWAESGIRQEIRWTGRISFILFCLAFGATGIHGVMKQSLSWWLRMNRKYFGISFALIHLIHLVFVIILQTNFHPVFERAAATSLFGGGVAYFFVVMMLLTSFNYFAKRIGLRNWKILHTAGGYWIWTIFMTTYVKRLDEPVHWIFVLVLSLVLLLRLRVILKK